MTVNPPEPEQVEAAESYHHPNEVILTDVQAVEQEAVNAIRGNREPDFSEFPENAVKASGVTGGVNSRPEIDKYGVDKAEAAVKFDEDVELELANGKLIRSDEEFASEGGQPPILDEETQARSDEYVKEQEAAREAKEEEADGDSVTDEHSVTVDSDSAVDSDSTTVTSEPITETPQWYEENKSNND